MNMTITWQELLSLTRQGDCEKLKFYGSIYHEDELGPMVTAMANTHGGRIIVGFDVHNYHLIGTDVDDSWVRRVLDQWCYPVPECQFSYIERADKKILVLSIETSQKKPYYYKNKCYVLNMDQSKMSVMEKQNSTPDVFVDEDQQEVEPVQEVSQTEDVLDHQKIEAITDELVDLADDIGNAADEGLLSFTKPEAVVRDTASTEESPLLFSENLNKPLNKRQEDTLIYLTKHLFIKNKTYRTMFEVSHKTAHLELVDLVNRNLILSKGMGRSTRYELNVPIKQSTSS